MFLSSCERTDNENPTNNRESIVIENLELFSDFDRHGLVRPVQIETLPNGNVAVLDNQTNKVHILDINGKIITSFGGEGRGPCESLSAMQLQISDEAIYVVDSNQRRINQFNHEGGCVQSFNFDTGIFRSYVTVKDSESYFTMSMGKNGALVRLVDLHGDSTYYFGEAMGKEYRPGDLEVERRTLQRGGIPDLMKNEITKYFSDDHLYVFLNVYSRLQKYTEQGDLLWDQEIDMPVNEAIFEKVVERAHEPESQGGVPVLRYILSMKVVDDQPYLLWYPVDDYPQHLVKTNKDGDLETIFDIRNDEFVFFDFTLDSRNNILYLIDSETSQIYRTKMPA
ncbi:6-bladed beta-propeller [Gracilimonas sp.]|uniref:6-bladed beta-propeller n=1 Tax=Gracilimonas sp. TaxID=1974203 RepID=UPI0025BC5C68|nr:6-bladed beta-propeller [Gracilimonas sp.]